jgi:hypothetical protein
MKIDIDNLSEAELIDLNHRIVQRLRFIHQMRSHVEMLEFRIGERVEFEPAGHQLQMGVVTRHNQKTVTVITDSGQRWNVSPQLLRHASESNRETTSNPNIIHLPER